MPERKKHHFVPHCYLKRFSFDGINIFTKIEEEIRLIPLRQQNQKDYLYSLGREIFGDKHNSVENFFGKKVEDPFGKDMSVTIDMEIVPKNEELVSLVYFAIIQSCRPLLYKDQFEQYFKLIGLTKEENPLLNYGFVVLTIINKFWVKIKTCSVEILSIGSSGYFITSDNPSTLWIPRNGNMEFVSMTLIFLYETDPDLELLMPLSPKYLLRVYLNRPRPVSQTVWNPNHSVIMNDELNSFNSRINSSKHRMIYSNSSQQLEGMD